MHNTRNLWLKGGGAAALLIVAVGAAQTLSVPPRFSTAPAAAAMPTGQENVQTADTVPAPARTAMRASAMRVQHDMTQLEKAVVPQGVHLRANVCYGEFNPCGGLDKFAPHGMARVPLAEGEAFEFLLKADDVVAHGSGVEIDGIYYMLHQDAQTYERTLRKYDAQTWQLLSETTAPAELFASAMTYCPQDGLVYGGFNDGADFGVADLKGDCKVKILQPGQYYNGLACDASGQVFGIDDDGDLYKIERPTGKRTLVGNTGLIPQSMSSMAFDRVTGGLYWAFTNEVPKKGGSSMTYGGMEGSLVQVDTETAQCRLVTFFPRNEELVGMYSPQAYCLPTAPALATGLQWEFSDEYSGTLSFTLPTTTDAGDALACSLTWKVFTDGELVEQGTAQPGSRMEVAVEWDDYDEKDNTLSVVTVNDRGEESAKAALHAWSGEADYDALTCSPALWSERIDDTHVRLWWQPVAAANNSCILDEYVSYMIKRDQDSKYFKDMGNDTEYIAEIPQDQDADKVRWSWTLYSYYDYMPAGGTRQSDPYFSGTVPLPYRQVFNKYNCLYQWTLQDINNDMSTWNYDTSEQALRIGSNFSNPHDDWAVMPPVHMEKNKMYKFWFPLSVQMPFSNLTVPGVLEIKYGKGWRPGELTETLLPATEYAEDFTNRVMAFYITPAEDGDYFIGFHALSPVDGAAMHLKEASVEDGCLLGSPQAVSALTAAAGTGDAHKTAVISATLPGNAIDGTDLTEALSLTLQRNGETVKTLAGLNAGQRIEMTDEVENAGEYTYRLSVANDKGAGIAETVQVWLGPGTPVNPQDIAVAEEGHTGALTINWAAVTEDDCRRPLYDGEVTYTVTDRNTRQTVAEGLAVTTLTIEAPEDATQRMAAYTVKAVTESGESAASIAPLLPVGNPYELPWSESAAEGKISTVWGSWTVQGVSVAWSEGNDYYYSDVQSYDQDGGYIMMRASYESECAALELGKINLGDLPNPSLTLQAFNLVGDIQNANRLTVQGRTPGGEWTTVRTLTMSDLPEEGWNKVIAPLQDYAGQVVQLRLLGEISHYATMFVDDLRIETQLEHNLALAGINIPDAVDAGSNLIVTANVENLGTETAQADAWNLEVYLDGNLDTTLKGRKIAFGQQALQTYKYHVPMNAGETVEVELRLVCTADEDTAEGHTSSKTVEVRFADVVPATGLEAEADRNGAHLTWTAPDLSLAKPAEVTETFDDVDGFTMDSFNGWTLIDADAELIGGISGYDLPGIPDLGEGTCGFFVMGADFDWNPYNDLFAAHSGGQYLAQFYNQSGQADDWAISPELYGGAQTISFWTRGLQEYYTETLQILASQTGTDPEDFTEITTLTIKSQTWTQYSVALPEGTRHFALRCISNWGYMTLIDDVTFIPAGAPRQLHLTGYNVYRDGECINASDNVGTDYTDPNFNNGHSYYVTALYEEGESRASNTVSPTSAVAMTAGAHIASVPGGLRVTGAEGCKAEIFNASGTVLGQRTLSPDEFIALDGGMYILTLDGRRFKVMVK